MRRTGALVVAGLLPGLALVCVLACNWLAGGSSPAAERLQLGRGSTPMLVDVS
jgi:hypothetical protein